MKRPKEWHGNASGGRHTKEYQAWTSMRYRCERPTHPSYKDYGGRGITVCEQWRSSFVAFLEDMGQAKPGQSLDRIDVNGDYGPENCRWATRRTQQSNRRGSVWLTYQGERMPISAAAAASGINRDTIYARMKQGWPESRWCEAVTRKEAVPRVPKRRRAVAKRDGSKERKAYEAMRDRCYNAKNPSWRSYGGRGISVCDRWLDSYSAFLSDMGEAPAGTSLERIDVNKGYGPENCRWATTLEQHRNRTETPWVSYDGQRVSLSEAAEKAGLNYNTVWKRWHQGWPEDRLFEPATNRRRRTDLLQVDPAKRRRARKIHFRAVPAPSERELQ